MHGRKIVSKNPGRYKMFINAFPVGTDTIGITRDGQTIAKIDMTWDQFWDFYYEAWEVHKKMERGEYDTEKAGTAGTLDDADECFAPAEEEQTA